MKAYTEYKKWWKLTQAPGLIPTLYWGETEDEAFIQHVNSKSLYEFMEILERWSDD